MSPHFAAYSFVDRITELVPAKRGRALFAVPSHLDAFSPCLVAEAVGQLAAWVSMAHIDFRGRPVAALATETRFHGEAIPGRTLDLSVEIQSCDDEAVAYGGRADVDGQPVSELVDCLGPMLPVADFDSPDALRERFALLCDGGAPPERFHGVEPPEVVIDERVPGASLKATLRVPVKAPFFADHFPRKAVFPATLLLDTQMRLAVDLARESRAMAGATPKPVRMTHVKMRSFIVPSQLLSIAVSLSPGEADTIKAMLSAATDGRTVASARLELARAPVNEARGRESRTSSAGGVS